MRARPAWRGRGVVAAGAAAVIAGAVAFAVVASRPSRHAAAAHASLVGHAAPPFRRPVASLRGGAFSLRSGHGHPILLSFLDTQASASRSNDPSRAQVVFLKSMSTQHRAYGLQTVIVDAGAARSRPPSPSALINFTFDWALGPSIAVVGDPRGAIARAYGVTGPPSTFLIDKRGIVRARWDGLAAPAQLDFAIRPLVGRPAVP